MTDPSPDLIHLENYTVGAKQAVVDAQKAADKEHHAQFTVLHLLAILLAVGPVQTHLRERGGDPPRALEAVRAELALLRTSTEPSYLSATLLSLLKRAEKEAGSEKVTIAVLLDVCARRETARTLADLDAHGLGENAEEHSWERVIAAGSLQLTAT